MAKSIVAQCVKREFSIAIRSTVKAISNVVFGHCFNQCIQGKAIQKSTTLTIVKSEWEKFQTIGCNSYERYHLKEFDKTYDKTLVVLVLQWAGDYSVGDFINNFLFWRMFAAGLASHQLITTFPQLLKHHGLKQQVRNRWSVVSKLELFPTESPWDIFSWPPNCQIIWYQRLYKGCVQKPFHKKSFTLGVGGWFWWNFLTFYLFVWPVCRLCDECYLMLKSTF